MVQLEHARPPDAADAIGAAVEARAQDHDLLDAASEGFTEPIVDVPGADGHGASRARPVAVDERPRQGGADQRPAREVERAAKAPVDERRGERIIEEAGQWRARGLYRPPERD